MVKTGIQKVIEYIEMSSQVIKNTTVYVCESNPWKPNVESYRQWFTDRQGGVTLLQGKPLK